MGPRREEIMKEIKTGSSLFHKKILGLVKECYPGHEIKEEVTIKVDGKTLFLDIYIPRMKIAFECDGIQHAKFNKFYHGDITSFQRQKKNDELKDSFCRESGIILVRVAYEEKISKDLLFEKIMRSLKDE